MTVDNNYRVLTAEDVEQAADVISQSFINDPLASYMLLQKRTRQRTLDKFFRAYGAVSIKNNRVYGVGDPLQGVAYWKAPNQENMSISVKSILKLVPLLFTGYPLGYIRARAILGRIDELHKKYGNEPHFYLDNIGVLPSAQGRGVASKLIRPALKMADAQKVIVYTDTVTQSNVPFYEHFGFQCVEKCSFPDAKITVWALRRPVQ